MKFHFFRKSIFSKKISTCFKHDFKKNRKFSIKKSQRVLGRNSEKFDNFDFCVQKNWIKKILIDFFWTKNLDFSKIIDFLSKTRWEFWDRKFRFFLGTFLVVSKYFFLKKSFVHIFAVESSMMLVLGAL